MDYKLDYKVDSQKSKEEEQVDKYIKLIQFYDKQKIASEFVRINSKLAVPFVDAQTSNDVGVDISNDAEQKNRLYVRRLSAKMAKWVNSAIQLKKLDYSKTWQMINATYASPTMYPDYDSKRIVLGNRYSFADTLSLKGLMMYNKFLLSIANSVLFDDRSFLTAVKLAKVMVFPQKFNEDKLYDNKILPKNWPSYYKYAMQQKALYTRLSQMENAMPFEK